MLNINTLQPRQIALAIGIALAVIICGAWIFQFAGYEPCELCYYQRWAYYAGIPVALLLFALNPSWIRGGLWLLALMLFANAIFGVWHSGIEWGWWKGPASCTGGAIADGLPDLSKPGVMCDVPSLRILGLSLAGWSAIICASLGWLALKGARKA